MTVMEVRPDNIEIHETGAEPEFFITHFGRVEVLPGGCVRIYCCSQRDLSHLRVEYCAIVPMDRLAIMAKEAIQIVAEGHNALSFAIKGDELPN